MNRRDDDDFWTTMALLWIMQEDEPEKSPQTDSDDGGCLLWLLGIGAFMFLAKWQHPVADVLRVGSLLYLIYRYGIPVSKFLIRFIFSIIISNIIGGFVLVVVSKLAGRASLSTTDILFVSAVYIGSFIYAYCVTCPWLTKKAKDIVKRRKPEA